MLSVKNKKAVRNLVESSARKRVKSSNKKKFLATIEVRLKDGQRDPEAETVKGSLSDLGFSTESVKTAKVYKIIFEASSLRESKDLAKEMCSKLLANPVKDDYQVSIERIASS